MNHFTRSKYFAIVIFFLAASSAISAESQRNYTNHEFGFSFQYPASWTVTPTSTANSRAKVASPTNAPHAECAVIVQCYPQAASVSQVDIDQIFTGAPSPAELKSALSQGANDVEILAVSTGALHSRPAHLARTRYNIGIPAGRAFVSGRIAMTATPGLTWTLSCGGQGNTAVEAERSYQFWQLEINKLISSFRFK